MTIGACMLVAGLAMTAATFVPTPWLKIVLLSLGFTLPSLTFIIGPAIVGEIAPAVQRGTGLLVIYSIMTLSALVSPAATGWIIEHAGVVPLVGYTQALWLTGGILVFGALWAMLGLDPERSRARFSLATVKTSSQQHA